MHYSYISNHPDFVLFITLIFEVILPWMSGNSTFRYFRWQYNLDCRGRGGGGRELHASDAHTGSVSAVNLHAIFAPAVYTKAFAAEVLAWVLRSRCTSRLQDSVTRNVQCMALLHVYYACIYKCLLVNLVTNK